MESLTTTLSSMTQILNTVSTSTQEFIDKINHLNEKYKKQREDLKGKIAETARRGAVKVLSNENTNTMGNPNDLCSKLQELQLEYNRITQMEKEETTKLMDEYNKVIAGNLNNGSGWWNQYKTQVDINDWIKKAALCDHVLQSPSLNIHSLWTELQKPQYKGVWTDVGGTYRRYIDQMGFTITNSK
tara:strand:- start:1039 stop:1596 length:558 start_codon:yes stop_codon:yes gene_type:complete